MWKGVRRKAGSNAIVKQDGKILSGADIIFSMDE
jgi:hypothetical protein